MLNKNFIIFADGGTSAAISDDFERYINKEMNVKLRQKFIPDQNPTERELLIGTRGIMIEGAVASVIYAAATNNIMTGYLGYLGASVAACASIALIPQLGCILQFFSPFLFERFCYRKPIIWILCVIYRFSAAAMFLLPLLLSGAKLQVGTAVALYIVAFASAGIVTPGLQQWTISLVDVSERGVYMAKKDILAVGVNSIATFLLSRHLDKLMALGRDSEGYQTVGLVCLVLALLDAVLLLNVCERPVEETAHIQLSDVFLPLKDKSYRPLFLYNILSSVASGIATPFLIVYQLRVLGLSHTFLASAGIVAAIAGMAGSYLWGRFSDRHTWDWTIHRSAAIGFLCTMSWAFVTPESAFFIAPILMIITTACNSGTVIANTNLQYSASPATGKTLYLGVTAAIISIAGCLTTACSASLQSVFEESLGYKSISVLFLLSGVGGLINLFINGRKLPHIK